MNSYPEKKLIPYQHTQVDMTIVIAAINKLEATVELKRAVYIFFRNESNNGKSGINNNYGGIQADSGRWPAKYDSLITGVVKKVDSGNDTRLFCSFATFQDCLVLMAGRLQARGLYIGGSTYKVLQMYVDSPNSFARAYWKEWVKGSATAEPPAANIHNFIAMYTQAAGFFK